MNLKTLIEQLLLIQQQAAMSKGPQYAQPDQLRVWFEQQPVVAVHRHNNHIILTKNELYQPHSPKATTTKWIPARRTRQCGD
jgi:hypothetical protein